MCQLLETIRVKEKQLQNLSWHNDRVNYSRRALFGICDTWDLSRLIQVPELDPLLIYRCRLLYSQTIDEIQFIPYTPRFINKLYLVPVSELDYAFKYAKRDMLEHLKQSRVQEPDEDVLLVKNGLLTDTTFSNIVFYDGDLWITPDLPLLRGTKRAMYLKNGIIFEQRITPADLHRFQKARLINAMLDLDTGNDIAIRNIIAM